MIKSKLRTNLDAVVKPNIDHDVIEANIRQDGFLIQIRKHAVQLEMVSVIRQPGSGAPSTSIWSSIDTYPLVLGPFLFSRKH